jgi:hypothetical protein
MKIHAIACKVAFSTVFNRLRRQTLFFKASRVFLTQVKIKTKFKKSNNQDNYLGTTTIKVVSIRYDDGHKINMDHKKFRKS